MRPTHSLKVAVAALALGAGVTLVLPSLATGADSPPSTAIQLGSATIDAKGAVLNLTVTITCPVGSSAQLFGAVTERSGNGIAQGYTNGPTTFVSCTGEPQTLTLTLTA